VVRGLCDLAHRDGYAFFSLVANAGILYFTGSLCFLLAVLAPLVSFYW
jgi:hypothetical protein